MAPLQPLLVSRSLERQSRFSTIYHFVRIVSSPRLSFSSCSIVMRKPCRPQPIGEIVAHFPQINKTEHIKEDKEAYATRWKRYLGDLGSSAAPKRLEGPDFGSRVRRRTQTDIRRPDAGKHFKPKGHWERNKK